MTVKYKVVPDSNVWVSELLLQSSIGSALLHEVTQAGANIGLPEIVEKETAKVLLDRCEKAVGDIQKASRLLQIVAQRDPLYLTVPSEEALMNGVSNRWKQLDGSLERMPFSLEIAQLSLDRVMAGKLPSAQNNEQFRDCCIWECAIKWATVTPVHLITSDGAFFEGRDRRRGIAKSLADELKNDVKIEVHASVADFLTSVGATHDIPDTAAISSAIEARVRAILQDSILSDEERSLAIELRRGPELKGYATPQASIIAISFEVSYRLEGAGEPDPRTIFLTLTGTCSYDPGQKAVTDVAIQQQSRRIREGQFNWTYDSGVSVRDYARQMRTLR